MNTKKSLAVFCSACALGVFAAQDVTLTTGPISADSDVRTNGRLVEALSFNKAHTWDPGDTVEVNGVPFRFCAVPAPFGRRGGPFADGDAPPVFLGETGDAQHAVLGNGAHEQQHVAVLHDAGIVPYSVLVVNSDHVICYWQFTTFSKWWWASILW